MFLVLVCGCVRTDINAEYSGKVTGGGILDRGVVDTLKCLNVPTQSPQSVNDVDVTMETSPEKEEVEVISLWNDIEDEESTRRLALVAYCDAADLDGSDPTIWLKLACAARRLGLLEKGRSLISSKTNYGKLNEKGDSNTKMDVDGDVGNVDSCVNS
jgi:hypothetical protein